MRVLPYPYAICMLLLLLLSGCQTLPERKQAMVLEDTLRRYEASFRWGAIDQLYHFNRTEQAAQVSGAVPDDLRIVHYEVVQGPTKVSANKALQSVRIQYLRESNQVVRELLDSQTWVYKPETKGWFIESPLPVFK